jgi:hypothetical protein
MNEIQRFITIATAILAGQPLNVCAQDATSASPLADELASHQRALTCLATAIAYEAGHEPVSGQRAVAEVILNRVRNPLFPKSVCGVVFEGSFRRTGCQFSFTCDGSLRRKMSDMVMVSATAVAKAALDGGISQFVAGATHYHADYVSPYWAPSLVRLAQIGRHIFYRMPGARDLGSYPGLAANAGEPVITALDPALVKQVPAALDPAQSGPPAPLPQRFEPWGLSISNR